MYYIGKNTIQYIFTKIKALISGKADKSVVKNVTVSSTLWTGSEAPYKATVLVEGVTTTNCIEVTLSGTETEAQAEACANAQIIKITKAANSITLHAYGEKPTVTFPIVVIIRGDL